MRITDLFQTLTPQQKAWLPCLVLAAAVFAAYANVYQYEFVWDDMDMIVSNKALLHWSDFLHSVSDKITGSFYRPVQMLLYFFTYQVFGPSKAAFHGVNVLLQAVNACLVYRLGCRLGFYQRAAFAAALLWGVHPLWSETVTYISGTASLLVAFFLILGLLVLLPDFKPRKFWLSCLFLLPAFGSKETAVVFPALVMFTLFLISKQRLHPATYLRTWPLWLLTAAFVIGQLLVFHDLRFHGSFDYNDSNHVEFYENNIINRLLTSLATLPVYLRLLIWPTAQHMDWHFPIFVTVWAWQVLAGIVIVALSLWQIIRGKARLRRNKYSSEAGHGLPLTWGVLWFAAAFSPNSGILVPINAIFAENWIYLPMIGLSLGVTQTAVVWLKTVHSKKPLIAAAGLVALAAVALGTKTYHQNEFLRDPPSVYENIIKYHPESPMAHYGLGEFYFSKGEYKKAKQEFYIDENYGYSLDNDCVVSLHTLLAFIALNIRQEKDGSTSEQDITSALRKATGEDIHVALEELKLVHAVSPNGYGTNEFMTLIYYYLGDKKKGDYYKAIAEKNLLADNPSGSISPPHPP